MNHCFETLSVLSNWQIKKHRVHSVTAPAYSTVPSTVTKTLIRTSSRSKEKSLLFPSSSFVFLHRGGRTEHGLWAEIAKQKLPFLQHPPTPSLELESRVGQDSLPIKNGLVTNSIKFSKINKKEEEKSRGGSAWFKGQAQLGTRSPTPFLYKCNAYDAC